MSHRERSPEVKALVVYETCYGNTGQIAHAIAKGLADHATVEIVNVDDAKGSVPDDVELVVVGGPTHAFSMSRANTREDAVRQGGLAPADVGIREWIERVTPRDSLRVVTFDTRVHVRMLPGSAAKSAVGALKHKGFRRAERGESFWVGGTPGPLSHDEVVRARAWGAALAGQFVGSTPAN